MATQQVHNRKGFFPKNPRARTNKYAVAASQTLHRGDAVILSTGTIAIAVANSAELVGVIAQDAVLLASGTLVEVWDDPDEIFVGRFDDTSTFVAGDNLDLTGATGAMQLSYATTDYNHFILLNRIDMADALSAGVEWAFRINVHALADTSS